MAMKFVFKLFNTEMAELNTQRKQHLKDQCIVCSLLFSSVESTPSGRKIKSVLNENKELKCTQQIMDELQTYGFIGWLQIAWGGGKFQSRQ